MIQLNFRNATSLTYMQLTCTKRGNINLLPLTRYTGLLSAAKDSRIIQVAVIVVVVVVVVLFHSSHFLIKMNISMEM